MGCNCDKKNSLDKFQSFAATNPLVKDWKGLYSSAHVFSPVSAITYKNGWLKFKDFCHFEATIYQLDQNGVDVIREFEFRNNFYSLRKLNEGRNEDETDETDADNDILDFEPLTAVLNTEGVIEIGNTVYKLDVATNRLFIIPSSEINEHSKSHILPINKTSQSINLEYSDVEITDNCFNDENTNDTEIALRCRGCNNMTDKSVPPQLEYKTGGVLYRFKAKVLYRNIGILHYLQLRVKHQHKNNPGSLIWRSKEAPELRLRAEAYFTRRCNRDFYKNPDITKTNEKRHTHNLYVGARKLSSFNVRALIGGVGLDNQLRQVELSISC